MGEEPKVHGQRANRRKTNQTAQITMPVQMKFSKSFLSKWAMDQNWLRTARKSMEERAIWAGLEAVNGLVEKLEILDDEVRTLNDMQEARVKNQNRNKA